MASLDAKPATPFLRDSSLSSSSLFIEIITAFSHQPASGNLSGFSPLSSSRHFRYSFLPFNQSVIIIVVSSSSFYFFHIFSVCRNRPLRVRAHPARLPSTVNCYLLFKVIARCLVQAIFLTCRPSPFFESFRVRRFFESQSALLIVRVTQELHNQRYVKEAQVYPSSSL